MRDGAMANAQLTNYIIPTTLDTPPIDVVLLEKPYAHGPYGAKGVGEMPIDGPAPAVVNAIRSLGVDIREIPATPERMMAAPRIARRGVRASIAMSRRASPHRVHAQREAGVGARASAEAAARRAARGLRPDRHQGRLRRRRVRRVHGAARRTGRQLVPRAGRAGGGREGGDDRGAEAAAHPLQRAFVEARRRAVRHLHAGHDHGGRRAGTAPDARRRAHGPRRQHLPLHRVRGDLQGHQEGRSQKPSRTRRSQQGELATPKPARQAVRRRREARR